MHLAHSMGDLQDGKWVIFSSTEILLISVSPSPEHDVNLPPPPQQQEAENWSMEGTWCLSIFHSWCLNRAWSMILQPILHTSTEEACEDRLAAL